MVKAKRKRKSQKRKTTTQRTRAKATGRVGRTVPRYMEIRHPFHIKYSKPLPQVNRISKKLPIRLRLSRKHQNYVSPATLNPIQMVVKGHSQTLYSKGKKYNTPFIITR